MFVVGSDAPNYKHLLLQANKHLLLRSDGELAAGRFLAQNAWPSDRVWMALLPSAARSSVCKSPTARFVLRLIKRCSVLSVRCQRLAPRAQHPV